MMEQETALRKYIRPATWLTVVMWVMLAALVLAVTLAAAEGKSKPAAASAFAPAVSKSGDYVYVDVIGVSDWACEYDDDTYYTMLGSDGLFYTARMSKTEFHELKAYNDWWNEEDVSVPAPEPTRLYGLARTTGSEVADLLSQAWELGGADEARTLFGPTFLDVGATPSAENAAMWIALSMFFFFCWLIFFCIWAPTQSKASKCVKRLEEQGWMPAAAAEFAASQSCEPGKDRVRLTEHFMFGKHTGAAVAYADVLWCYRKTVRYNFIAVSETLLLQTAWGRNIPLLQKNASEKSVGEDVVNFLFRAINTQNPTAMIGFTPENIKAYRAARKAQRG